MRSCSHFVRIYGNLQILTYIRTHVHSCDLIHEKYFGKKTASQKCCISIRSLRKVLKGFTQSKHKALISIFKEGAKEVLWKSIRRMNLRNVRCTDFSWHCRLLWSVDLLFSYFLLMVPIVCLRVLGSALHFSTVTSFQTNSIVLKFGVLAFIRSRLFPIVPDAELSAVLTF